MRYERKKSAPVEKPGPIHGERYYVEPIKGSVINNFVHPEQCVFEECDEPLQEAGAHLLACGASVIAVYFHCVPPKEIVFIT